MPPFPRHFAIGEPGDHHDGAVGVGDGGEAQRQQVPREVRLEARSGVIGDDAALVHHHDPLGVAVGLLEVGASRNTVSRGAAGASMMLLPQVRAALRVEARRRLVEEDAAAARA